MLLVKWLILTNPSAFFRLTVVLLCWNYAPGLTVCSNLQIIFQVHQNFCFTMQPPAIYFTSFLFGQNWDTKIGFETTTFSQKRRNLIGVDTNEALLAKMITNKNAVKRLKSRPGLHLRQVPAIKHSYLQPIWGFMILPTWCSLTPKHIKTWRNVCSMMISLNHTNF